MMQRVQAGRMPHALLISGVAGLGKRQFAEQLVASLLCEAPDSRGHACQQCKTCLLYAAGTHPDIHHVLLEEDAKAIKVDQIRQLSEVMAKKPQLGGYRLAIICPAETMNTNAANALLKTLEEPGAMSLLILVSAEPGRLPATIRSRCQQLSFHCPATSDGIKWLEEQGVDGDPQLLLKLAQQAPLQALQYDREQWLTHRNTFMQEFLQLKTGVQNPLQLADKWYKSNPEHCLIWMMLWIMDLIRIKSGSTPEQLVNTDAEQYLQPLAKQLDLSGLYAFLDKLQQGNRLLGSQINSQLMLEDIFIEWIKTR